MKDLKREDLINQWNSLLWSKSEKENKSIKSCDMELEDNEICWFKIAFTKDWHIAPAMKINEKYWNDAEALDKWADEMIKFLTDRCLVWTLRTLAELWAYKEILIYALKNITTQGVELLSLWEDKVWDLFNSKWKNE